MKPATVLLSVFSVALGLPVHPRDAIADVRPNIVLLLADDLGYGDLSCFGSPAVKTPHLDKLAGEGRRFSSFYAASAVCSPTRAAVLTGRYAMRRTQRTSRPLPDITGANLSDEVQHEVEGRSLLPLLKNPRAEWPDRTLVHHVGRWAAGTAGEAKHAKCAIQNSRFTLVNDDELYDLQSDSGETKNVIAEHPELVANLRSAYDQWWSDVQPLQVNEDAVAPNINPLKELYWKQFGGGPDEAMLRKMDPAGKSGARGQVKPRTRRKPRTEM